MAIQHTVAFTLVHSEESAEEADFLSSSKAVLAGIPGVFNFRIRRQVSPKSKFRFQFSMEFMDRTSFSDYENHPAHMDYVATRWVQEVAHFQELDFMDW